MSGRRALATTGRTDQPDTVRFLPSMGAFLRDFGRYAGRGVFGAGVLVAVGAVLESLGLVMLILTLTPAPFAHSSLLEVLREFRSGR